MLCAVVAECGDKCMLQDNNEKKEDRNKRRSQKVDKEPAAGPDLSLEQGKTFTAHHLRGMFC